MPRSVAKKKAKKKGVKSDAQTSAPSSTLTTKSQKSVQKLNSVLEERKELVKDLLAANYSYRIIIGILVVLLIAVYVNTPTGVEHISVMHQNAFEIQQLVIENWEKANISLPHV